MKILVGFPAGGGTDAIARTLAEKLKDELGVTVIVENKPGAGGQLAAQALKAAAADGSTFFISHDHTISVLPLVAKAPGFDPAKDFTPVAGFASFVNAFAVSPGTPAKSLADYVAWVKGAGQGKGVVGVPAPASTPEFMVKLLGGQYQLDLVPAPYRGSAPMLGDMLGNQINAGIGSVPDFIENHKAGRIRMVAVGGSKRQATLPEVPTLAELGIAGFEDLPYYGFFAPAGTPKAALDNFAAALGQGAGTAGCQGSADGPGPDGGVHGCQRAGRTRKDLHQELGGNHPQEWVHPAVGGCTGGGAAPRGAGSSRTSAHAAKRPKPTFSKATPPTSSRPTVFSGSARMA